MKLLVIPAVSGAFFNDILVLLSFVGSSLLFLAALGGPRLGRLEEVGEWCTAPLVFGIFFQVSQRIVGFQPEQIGFLVPMPPGLVDGLFAVSLLMVGGWWLKKKSNTGRINPSEVNMIQFNVPGPGDYSLEHLVMDVNGTLAVDGRLIEGVVEKLAFLQGLVKIHLLTADTHGKQYLIDQQLGLTAVRIQPGNEALQKAEYVRRLGRDTVAAIGQGANDAEMLKAAKLGICVLSVEGVARDTLLACDLVAPTILSALELLEKPARIKASLRR